MKTYAKIEDFPTSQTKLEPGAFIRFEDKYLISKDQLKSFENLVFMNLDPCYPDENTRYTKIESLYFDSSNLDFFCDHFKKTQTRYKMRIRRYGPNGVWQNTGTSFLEIKSKSNKISKKRRIQLTDKERKDLILGKKLVLTKKFLDANPELTLNKLAKRVQEINNMVNTFNLAPQVRVTYSRRAYEKDGLRITLDTDVQINRLNFIYPAVIKNIRHQKFWEKASKIKSKFSTEKNVIVEIKHKQNVPEWFINYMRDNSSTETSFSKYCWSIMHQIPQPPQLKNRKKTGVARLFEVVGN